MKHLSIEEWASSGTFLSIPHKGLQLFYKDLGTANAAPDKTLLLLHGFPESSYSFHKIIPGLRETFDRIIVFDMIGYGLSDKPTEHYSYSLIEQADIALYLWQQLQVKGGHLLSHDMGNSVATELAAREVGGLLPAWFTVGFSSYTFTNGSIVLELANLRITQKLLLTRWGPILSKMFSFRLFEQQVQSAHGNQKLSKKDLEMLWAFILLKEGQFKNYLIIKYLNDRKKFEKSRWLPALTHLKKPIHLCWGDADQVARVEMAHYLKKEICPQATLSIMKGVGHFCQLGSPDIWKESITKFYKGL